MSKKTKKRLRGTVKKVLKSVLGGPEKAEIAVHDADPLYRELRVENELSKENGEKMALKPGAEIDVVIETDSDATIQKPKS